MVSQHGVDTEKLAALLANAKAGFAYAKWLDDFIVPLLKKIGLKVRVKKSPTSYIITVKLP
jgi:hypothetical protein